MPEQETYPMPNQIEATPFQNDDRIDLHAATSNLSDLGDARDLIRNDYVAPEVITSPEFGIPEAIRIDNWLEWMRTAYGDANWDLRS